IEDARYEHGISGCIRIGQSVTSLGLLANAVGGKRCAGGRLADRFTIYDRRSVLGRAACYDQQRPQACPPERPQEALCQANINMCQLARRSPRRAGQMEYTIRSCVHQNAIKGRGVPRRFVEDEVRGFSTLPAPERLDIDAVSLEGLDKISADEPLPACYDYTTHDPEMPHGLAQTSAEQARSRPAARYRAKHICLESRRRYHCWI